jgi:hypothetical protein
VLVESKHTNGAGVINVITHEFVTRVAEPIALNIPNPTLNESGRLAHLDIASYFVLKPIVRPS